MQIFSHSEKRIVIVTLLVIAVFSFFNFNIALRRGRDNERQNDLGDITRELDSFKESFGSYPLPGNNGAIKGCGSGKLLSDFSDCVWGKDKIANGSRTLPADPLTSKGYSYIYFSDGKFFQLFSSLEGMTDEDQYNPKIVARNLNCGKFICNFGKASSNTPLDITLEEYENKLHAK